MVIALPYVIFHYAVWHYTQAIREIINIWRNLIWFLWIFFSLGTMMRTLFSPWRRIREEAPKGLDLEAIGAALVVNMLMRVVGFFLRLFVIIIGFSCIILCWGALLASVILWILFPFVIPGLFSYGIAMLFA